MVSNQVRYFWVYIKSSYLFYYSIKVSTNTYIFFRSYYVEIEKHASNLGCI